MVPMGLGRAYQFRHLWGKIFIFVSFRQYVVLLIILFSSKSFSRIK